MLGSETQKKVCKGRNETPREEICLTLILAQYGLLEAITSHLFPVDLHSLASTSRAVYSAVFPRKESRSNLLKKMACDGTGIQIRKQCHKKSIYFDQFGCTEITKCRTQAKDVAVDSRPCISCGVTTCDECRIHCVYQNIFQPPEEEDELPNFSGFVLLSQPEMGILSLAHFGDTGPQAQWDCNVHHDQGILDSPLEAAYTGAPESIHEIINTDLGTGQLVFTYASNIPHPSPTIQAFWEVTEKRKRLVCNDCFEAQAEGQKDPRPQCHCTLKKQFLDRWLCLKCYKAEEQAQGCSQYGVKVTDSPMCRCGQQINEANTRLMCLWCLGEVATPVRTPTASI